MRDLVHLRSADRGIDHGFLPDGQTFVSRLRPCTLGRGALWLHGRSRRRPTAPSWRHSVLLATALQLLLHDAVTVDRTKHAGILFYLNGVQGTLTGDPTSHPGSLSNPVPLILGARSAAFSGAFWRGDLDEVELFDRVLRPDEIAAIAGVGTTGKCKCAALKITPRAWWRFDEPAGSTALDSGGDPQGPFDGFVMGAQRHPAGRVAGDLVFSGVPDAVAVPNDGPLALHFPPGATGRS